MIIEIITDVNFIFIYQSNICRNYQSWLIKVTSSKDGYCESQLTRIGFNYWEGYLIKVQRQLLIPKIDDKT